MFDPEYGSEFEASEVIIPVQRDVHIMNAFAELGVPDQFHTHGCLDARWVEKDHVF